MRPFSEFGFVAIAYIFLSSSGYGQSTENPAATVPDSTSTPAATEPTSSTEPNVETLICIRHGEKPHNEIGQLNLQGLNRSLALPKVLLAKYGKPQFIFAPNPAKTIGGREGNQYCYIRPLATIEPTAIFCGLPVNTQFGFTDNKGLEAELRKPIYQNALIFVAWEHEVLERFARALIVDLGGDGMQVPVWDKMDGSILYDAIYVIKITTQNGQSSVTFSIDREGLDNLSSELPSVTSSAPATPAP